MSKRIALLHYAGFSGLAAFLLFLMADGWGAVVAQHPVPTLRVEHLMQPQSVQALEFEAMSSDLEKERVARLSVAAADTTDGAARRLIENVRAGTLDMAIVPIAALGTYVPRFRAFEIPFLFAKAFGTFELNDFTFEIVSLFRNATPADGDFTPLDELRFAKVDKHPL